MSSSTANIIKHIGKYKVTIDEEGNKYWYFNGQLHRENGPAIELKWGSKLYYLYNTHLTHDQWQEAVKKIKLLYIQKMQEQSQVKIRNKPVDKS